MTRVQHAGDIDPDRFAADAAGAAERAVAAGDVTAAIGLLDAAVERLVALDPVPPVVGWLEYDAARLWQFMAPGDPDVNRDRSIALLERAVRRGIEVSPELFQLACGSLGDRWATRRRGDASENRAAALRAYELALRMPPPLAPVGEWALNSQHYGTTLLEGGGDDPAVAAEAVLAYWQSAHAALEAQRPDVAGGSVTGMRDAVDELARRVGLLGTPTPFEVAVAPGPGAGPGDHAWLRARAVVSVLMVEDRLLLTDQDVYRAGAAWELVASEAEEAGAESLRGVARHFLGRLGLALRAPLADDARSARQSLEKAALLIDPATHPWAWQQNEAALDRVRRAGGGS